MISMYAKIQRLTAVVLNTEMATEEWVAQWTADNPDSEYAYHYGWQDEPLHAASIGATWDEETTWFIPPSPGPEYHFDRNEWRWVADTPPQPPQD